MNKATEVRPPAIARELTNNELDIIRKALVTQRHYTAKDSVAAFEITEILTVVRAMRYSAPEGSDQWKEDNMDLLWEWTRLNKDKEIPDPEWEGLVHEDGYTDLLMDYVAANEDALWEEYFKSLTKN